MSSEILTKEQKENYGKFSGDPNLNEISKYFTLDSLDLDFISKRRGHGNKLGVALQLTCVRFLGTFHYNLIEVPTVIKNYVAGQLSITNLDILESYGIRETTKREHQALIRKQYQYKEYSKGLDSFRLTKLLYYRVWYGDEQPSLLFDIAASWLVKNKILLPGYSTLTRLIVEIRQRAIETLWKKLESLPSKSQKIRLNNLLNVSENIPNSMFDYYRKGPVKISTTEFVKAIKRYEGLRSFAINELDFSAIPEIKLRQLAKFTSITSAYRISRLPIKRKVAMLVAFVKTYETIALDDALDVFELLIAKIVNDAKRIKTKKRLRSLKDLDKAAVILAKVSKLVLNEKVLDSNLREAIFKLTSKRLVSNSVDIVNKLTLPENNHYLTEMVDMYGKIKKVLPILYKDIEFSAAPSGEKTLEVYNYLASLQFDKSPHLDNPPLEMITPSWKKLISTPNGKISKKGYTICFLNYFQDALKRRDIYVKFADRWGDPRIKLLNDNQRKANKNQICTSLGHSTNKKEVLSNLSEELDEAYNKVVSNFDENDSVSIDLSGKQPSLTIQNLKELKEPESLIRLKKIVKDLLPKIDLTELLLEVNGHTDFINSFTHISESKSRSKDLDKSICAVLIAEACNIGIEPLVNETIPALTRHRLNWVKQNYFREETLTIANAKLVDYQSRIALVKKWGGGMVASADGMRFVTPVKTINSGYNKKYFGSKRGITWYNFLSDQYSGFHDIVIPGTLRDSMYLLDGLLEQQTSLSPTEVITDTAGSSEMVFGLFWLLGYQFSPRFADAGESIFWRIDKDANYGPLNDISKGVIKKKLIEENLDDMLRVAGSLRLGKISASELIKTLLKSDKPSSLAKAIKEVGRINKTIYLLNFIDNPNYRRRILTQLNRGESRHSVARAICHGMLGEIRKRYKQGQENQLGALGLVTNALILWNTIYMEKALKFLKKESVEIDDKDLERLSPLVFKHVNMLGHYSFDIQKQFSNGKLRPLGNVNEMLKIIS